VHFTWTPNTLPTLARFCSALTETRTTDTFELSIDEEHEVGAIWPVILTYLTFRLFSEHTRKHSSVRHVRLAFMRLSSEDVAAAA